MLKRILAVLCLVTMFTQSVFALDYVPHTKIELDSNYDHGFQRLARTITKTKGIACTVEKIKNIPIKDKPDVPTSKYKVTLKSNVKWVNGHWIVDLVPYTKENMSITTARAKNPEYDWWFVYYNDKGQPEAVAWARYGE